MKHNGYILALVVLAIWMGHAHQYAMLTWHLFALGAVLLASWLYDCWDARDPGQRAVRRAE